MTRLIYQIHKPQKNASKKITDGKKTANFVHREEIINKNKNGYYIVSFLEIFF